MYGVSPFVLIVLPILFQIIYGRKSIFKNTKLKFGIVCLISFLSQILFSITGCAIAAHNFEVNLEGEEYHCGPGILGFVICAFFLGFVLLAVMIIQFIMKKYHEKKQSRNK